jgi:hypothetical protein
VVVVDGGRGVEVDVDALVDGDAVVVVVDADVVVVDPDADVVVVVAGPPVPTCVWVNVSSGRSHVASIVCAKLGDFADCVHSSAVTRTVSFPWATTETAADGGTN